MAGTSSCITSATWSRAILASSSYLMRTAGSTFAGVVAPAPASSPPPLAAITANCRAASQLSGPCPDNARDRSPNRGSPANGSIDSPDSSSSAMLGCYGFLGAPDSSCRGAHRQGAQRRPRPRYRAIDDRRADRRRGSVGRPGDRRIAGPLGLDVRIPPAADTPVLTGTSSMSWCSSRGCRSMARSAAVTSSSTSAAAITTAAPRGGRVSPNSLPKRLPRLIDSVRRRWCSCRRRWCTERSPTIPSR